ncbi:hypothetical protein [Brevibacterium aurantiacum]|uniref:GNAT family N-acetyltransferase n=1 Tax=Brevibacterium aurantiacum TaxID=273384 RepID=A0A556CMZ0_BREAU|nr:hypothetical protein [Brevibacterium aurantiacum]TSI18787.1 hypothetical protein FO013_04435 [Brevibacterium aurantiacum]
MSITLSRLDPNGADRSGLIDCFTNNDFPSHVRPLPWTAAGVEERIDSSTLRSDDYDTFWLHHEQLGNLGIVRLDDNTRDDNIAMRNLYTVVLSMERVPLIGRPGALL